MFCGAPAVVRAENLVFVDPSVSSEVVRKYFGSMISSSRWSIMSCAYVNDRHIMSTVLRNWLKCISKNDENRVSADCVAKLCANVFGPVLLCDNPPDEAECRAYCADFASELLKSPTSNQSSDCKYIISKHNNSQKRIKFEASDGSGFIRKDGYIAWRFFNPGNLRRSSLQCAQIDTNPNGKFAVFDSYETGRRALHALLRGSTYRDLTIEQAINKYAPPSENNTAGYVRSVKNSLSHLPNVDTITLKELSDADLGVLMDKIEDIEGWNAGVGEVIPIS